jgi:hypothetical protein
MDRSEAPVGMISLDDRVLHRPGPTHGVALCGEKMRDPWKCGPIHVVRDDRVFFPLSDDFDASCERCFDL